MIKSCKGKVETDGTGVEIIADITCLLVSFAGQISKASKGTLTIGEAFNLTIMDIGSAGNKAIQDLHKSEGK